MCIRDSLITDGDPETFWQSNPASVQLGGEPGTTKPGIGLLMTLPEGTALSQVQLRGLTQGTTLELRLAQADTNGKLASLDQTTLLKTVHADADDVTVDLAGMGADHADTTGDSGWGAGREGSSAAPGEGNSDGENEDAAGSQKGSEKGKYDTDKVSAAKGNRLLIWITGLPLPRSATLAEVTAVGNWLEQTSDEDADDPDADEANTEEGSRPARPVQPVG